MQTSLVFLSLQSDKFHKQTIFSILSLLYFYRNQEMIPFKIIIYTDKINFFRNYIDSPVVSYVEFTNKLAEEWISCGERIKKNDEIDIKTTYKIMSIKSTLEKHQGNAIFVDDDTFFLKPIDPLISQLSEKCSLMYLRENSLDDTSIKSKDLLREIFTSHTFKYNEKYFKIPISFSYWNAGVIGINFKNIHLLDEVLSLSTQLQNINESSYLIHDQIIFSYILQQHCELKETTSFIHHYCYNYKEKYNKLLKISFDKKILKGEYENNTINAHTLTKFDITKINEYNFEEYTKIKIRYYLSRIKNKLLFQLTF